MERMPPEYAARLRLRDPTLAFVKKGGGILLVEVLDEVTYPTSRDPYDRWYNFPIRVRSLGVHVTLAADKQKDYWAIPWVEEHYARWMTDDEP